MVEHKQQTVGTAVPTHDPVTVNPGQTKVHFQNPKSEIAYEGLTGIREGVPPSNEAVIVGIEQAKQSIQSSQALLTREGRTIQRDTLILLDLIRMIVEDRNSDEKMQQFLVCFRNLSQKYAPEFGDDIRYGVKHGWFMLFKGGHETSHKGAGKDVYNSIIGLRDFVFQVIRSSDFRDAMSEFFQYLQILAGEVHIDEKGSGNLMSKLASGIMGSSGGNKEESSEEKESQKDSSKQKEPQVPSASVVSAVGGSRNFQHRQEQELLPSQVHSIDDLKKNQGELSEPVSQQRQQQQQWQPSGQQDQQRTSFNNQDIGSTKNDYAPRGQQQFGQQQSGQQQFGQQQQSGQQQSRQPSATVVSSTGGSSNLQQNQEQELLPSQVHSMGDLKKNQGELSESGQQRQQQQQWQPSGHQGFGSNDSGIGSQSELKPTSFFGSTHQGIAPLQQSSSGNVGHFSNKNIVDDQYREPSEHSNVQAEQFRPSSQQPLGQRSSQYGDQQPQQQQQQWQPSQQQGFQSGIPQPPQHSPQYGQKQQLLHSGLSSGGVGRSQQSGMLGVGKKQEHEGSSQEKTRREIEDSLIDRYVQLNRRFSKDPNYQRALYGLFNMFNQAKSMFGDVQGSETTKTVEKMREDDDFKSLLNYAKLIIYEFSDKKIFDDWLDTTNAFFVHLKTDERLKGVTRDIMNDFRRYGNQPELLESHQEKEHLREKLWEFKTVLEDEKNMDLTNNMLTNGQELLRTMRNDELNAEIRERSQKLIKHLFLDEQGHFQLKPSALEQIRTILFVAIQEAINNWNAIEVEGDDGSQYFKISNISLKANDILPDDVKFKVKNRTSMKYAELKPSDKLAESATLIGAHLFGMTAHLKDVGFLFDRRSFPSISDRGLMDIDFDRGGINILLKLKARLSQNRPFYVKGVGVGVDTLHIKFKQAEKHKLMLKMLSPIIQSRVRRKIHDNLEQSLNTNVREMIERLNDLIEQAITQGNEMAGQGQGQGGMISGLMGRMGINTASSHDQDYPQEGGVYAGSRDTSHIPRAQDTSSNIPPSSGSTTATTTSRPPVQVVGSKERREVVD